jgi:two-component system sensor histidine kinase PilS (NtrC family)
MSRFTVARLPGNSRLSTLTIYRFYRVFLAAALLLVFVLKLDALPLPGSAERASPYLLLSAGYLLVALSTSLLVTQLGARERLQSGALIGIDILALTLLAHNSGSAASPVAPLLVMAVASGAVLQQGRITYVIAAAATLAMFYSQMLTSLAAGVAFTHGSTEVGLLGIAFFGIVIATNQLTAKLQQSEALARQRTEELKDLEDLNAHIIQRMRTGILVVDENNQIRLSNNAAQQMLVPSEWRGGKQLDALSQELLRRVTIWRTDQGQRFPPFRNHSGGPEIDTSMTALRLGDQHATLVFMEDLVTMSHHLQQMKLASLGRLTASIAHEIRNPLSAINHAAQLLAESRAIPQQDIRLTEIIQQQALRLDRIVENVLQLSRRQMPRTDLLEINSWLRQFRSDYLSTHPPGDELEISATDTPMRARFDPHHLQQILQNLCDNGMRHGRALAGHGHVTLQTATAANGEIPVLRILDNGAGIPAEKLGNLFEPFYTTDARGTGLGLYIARELCEANRARLSYVPATEYERGFFQITFAHPGRIAS